MSNQWEIWGYTVSAFVIGTVSGVVHSALRERGESAPASATSATSAGAVANSRTQQHHDD
jgi:hypothetical protein